MKWQAQHAEFLQAYYNQEAPWIDLVSKSLKEAMKESDGLFHGTKTGLISLSKKNSDHISAFRYADETEWIINGKGAK